MKRVIYLWEARMLQGHGQGPPELDTCPECRGRLWDGYYHPQEQLFVLFPPGEELIPRGTLGAWGCSRCRLVAPSPQGCHPGPAAGVRRP
ncbi:MAG: hypothetical protein ACUVTQ_02935 [Desulfotomaculales bacterium]